MATRNIVPRSDNEGGIGTTSKRWLNGCFHNLLDTGNLNFNEATELTISTGSITRTQTYHTVDTEADASSDDLTTISGGNAGDVLILRTSAARSVVIKHNIGNIVTGDSQDYTLDNVNKVVILIFNGTNWHLISGGGGGSASSGNPRRVINPSNMRLDDVNTGTDADTIFGIIDTVGFIPTETGSIWTTVEFNESDFDSTSDVIVDLIHVFDGDATDENVRLTVDVWVADIGEAPSIASPTSTQTSNLNVTSSTDNIIQKSSSFITIPASNFNSNTQTISLKITRSPLDVNDTYSGTYQLLKAVVRQ